LENGGRGGIRGCYRRGILRTTRGERGGRGMTSREGRGEGRKDEWRVGWGVYLRLV